MKSVSVKIIRHQDGNEEETFLNLQIDEYNPDLIIGESAFSQLILQGYVYDEGVQVESVHMPVDDMYTAGIVCVNGREFYVNSDGSHSGRIGEKVRGSEYNFIASFNNWFRIIDGIPNSIEFWFDSENEIWSCRIYQHEQTGKILLVFLAI